VAGPQKAACTASWRQRAPERLEGRDWAAEEKWVEWIIDQRLASLIEGIGQVREEMRSEFKAMIDAVRAELQEAIATRPAEVEIAARLGHISAGLAHLDRCLDRMAKADAALDRLSRGGGIELLPN
jgi:hypothetical protein